MDQKVQKQCYLDVECVWKTNSTLYMLNISVLFAICVEGSLMHMYIYVFIQACNARVPEPLSLLLYISLYKSDP